MMDFIYECFVELCLLIDKMFISINGALFGTFIEIAKHDIKRSLFDDITHNIYIVIGIFMIFRVAFSLIQMLANPDMLADKEKGAGKLAMRVVIVFAMIVMVPTIFEMAYGLQNAIINENIVGAVFNVGGIRTSGDSDATNLGKTMAIDIFKGMLEENTSNKCICGIRKEWGSCTKDQYNKADSISGIRYANPDNSNFDCFTQKDGDKYGVGYRPLISSVALGMMAWLMVGYCIDIGVRYIKLVFLQLIAPVCIATYVGGGKDNTFNKWIKMTTSTYLLVFMRLIIIYVIMFIASNLSKLVNELSGLSMVAVILGMLVFAKSAPKLLSDLFGIQESQDGGLFKGLAKTALLGTAAVGAAGGLAGISNLVKGGGDAWKNAGGLKGLKTADGWKKFGAGLAGAVGSGIGGTASGALHGGLNGFKKNASLGGSINKALMTSRTNRDNRDDRAAVYGGGIKGAWNNLVTDRLRGFAGLETNAKRIVNQRKNIGAGLSRAKSNVLAAQNQIAQYGVVDMDAVNSYSYNAFDKSWSRFDGDSWIEMKNADGTNMTLDQMLTSEENRLGSAFTGDERTYLQYTQQDSQLERRIIENNKLQGKAETQQARMEGSNGKNA